jgi:hypothetical protein
MSGKGNFEQTGRDDEYARMLNDSEPDDATPAPDDQRFESLEAQKRYYDEGGMGGEGNVLTPDPQDDVPADHIPPVGDEAYLVGDEGRAPGDPDSLEQLYIRKSKLAAKPEGDAGELTVEEGLSGLQEEPKKSYAGCIAVAVVFFILIGGGASTFLINRTFIGPDLNERSMALPVYYYTIFTMNQETRRLQNLTPDERAYLKTRSRMPDVYAAMLDYQTAVRDLPRRVSDIEEAGLMPRRRLIDGWEIPFRIRPFGEPAIVSSGPDMQFNTNDDIIYDGSAWRPPPLFEDVEDVPYFEE